uniref:Uncharacterized protein n=1 Tax=Tanacetum cinerariifolium TaxID=118510 RepID=A0A699WK38_TANCI|nr:hypothetical protein [Tanacetum cinerariifolium]
MSWVSCSCTAASSVTLVLTPSRVVNASSSAMSLGSIQASLMPYPISSAIRSGMGRIGGDAGVEEMVFVVIEMIME